VKPPRWKPLVLQKMIVPLGAVNVLTAPAGTRLASSSWEG
jgi:hypothetical protein